MAKSRIVNLFNIGQVLQDMADSTFVFWVTFLIYGGLWVINPGNKIVALGVFFLIGTYYWKLREFRTSLLLGFLASSIVLTGKQYIFQLAEPGIFPIDLYPLGYVLFFTITANMIVGAIMGLMMVRDLVVGKLITARLNYLDYIVIVYVLWKIISDLFGSVNPEVSLLFSISHLSMVVVYFFVRFYVKNLKKFWPIFLGLLASLIVFESLVAFQQFASRSPIFKNLEGQVDIHFSGRATDESTFGFRPTGTFQHANVLGMWLGQGLLILTSWLWLSSNAWLGIVLMLGLGVMGMTSSRSAWLGFFVGGLMVFYLLSRRLKIKPKKLFSKWFNRIIILSFFISILFVFPRLERSIYTFNQGGGEFRKMQVADTVGIVLANPMLGVGSNMSVLAGGRFNPEGIFSNTPLKVHNWYLLQLAEHGLIILLIFGVWIYLMFQAAIKWISKKKKANKLDSVVGVGVLTGVIVLLTVGLFQPFVGETQLIFSFAILQIMYGKVDR